MRRRPTILVVSAVVGAAGVAIAWLALNDTPNSPGEPQASSDVAYTEIELPSISTSAVEELRRKTVAGSDRFVVESFDEEIGKRLAVLRDTLLRKSDGPPQMNESLGDLFADDFRATPVRLSPKENGRRNPPRTRASRKGLLAVEETGFGEAELDRDLFVTAFTECIRPAAHPDRVQFKVVRIDGDAGPIRAGVLFSLAGGDPEARRFQLNGEADLTFVKESWKLRRWETKRTVRVQLDALPFQDVTETAIGKHRSYREHLSRSIDWFRARLDAASGVSVYGHNGIAVADVDNDGLDDIYVATPGGLPNVLYRARPDGTFDDISATSGTDILDNISQTLFVDVDNDRDADLFLVGDQSLHMLINDGNGRFEPRNDSLPASIFERSTPVSASAADYDMDGNIDLYVTSYVFWRGGPNSGGTTMPIPYYEAHNGAENFLLRGIGDGRFEDVTKRAGLNDGNSRFSFAAGWADYDDDNDPDLYVANDFGSNNLYRNNGDGTFDEVTRAAGVSDVGAGMSVAWADYDSDGDLDLYVGNMFSAAGLRVTSRSEYKSDDPRMQEIYRRHARGNSLFRNRGDGTFEDVSVESDAYFGRWAWGSDFLDFDLDGHQDLYVQNGFLTAPREHDL